MRDLAEMIGPHRSRGRGAALQSRLVRAIEPYARCHLACVVYSPRLECYPAAGSRSSGGCCCSPPCPPESSPIPIPGTVAADLLRRSGGPPLTLSLGLDGALLVAFAQDALEDRRAVGARMHRDHRARRRWRSAFLVFAKRALPVRWRAEWIDLGAVEGAGTMQGGVNADGL